MPLNSAERYAILKKDPSPRLPVSVLVDSSFSMNGTTGGVPTGGKKFFKDGKEWTPVTGGETRMKKALAAIGGFVEDIQSDLRARSTVEMSVLSFDTNVKILQDFEPVSEETKTLPVKVGSGDETNLGRGVKTSLALLDRRKKDYNDEGIPYFQPQLVILTDGAATDPDDCKEIAEEVQSRMTSNKLICLPFIIGNERDCGALELFAWKGQALRVQEVKLTQLFQYLSQSSIRVSHSQAGGSDGHTEMDKIYSDLLGFLKPADQI